HDQFAANFNGACPIIALEAVVTRDENNARAGGVQVYGVDQRFWKFHGANVQTPEGNDVLVSQALAQELSAKQGDTLVLRIEKPSAIPVESLHGRKDDLGRTIRLTMRDALPMASLGEFSLRPQQGAVRAIFVDLKKLQRNIEQDGKVNAILLAAKSASGQSAQIAGQILKDKFTLTDLGLKLRKLEEQKELSLESDSAIINDKIAEKAVAVAGKLGLVNRPILTYLVNTIRLGETEIPYSLVSGIEVLDGPKNRNFILLSDWSGQELKAKPGDQVTLEYYVWQEEGRLETKSANFWVFDVGHLKADRDYAPEYPGITQAKSLADWDPPFPIDLTRVRK